MRSVRDLQPEWMDDPALPESDHRRALAGLARLNRISGVSAAIYRQLTRYARQVGDRPLKVLDVASGSGDLPIDWTRWASRQRIGLQVTACDKSPIAVQAIRRRAIRLGITINAVERDCLADGLPTGFDVVTCSLFMHHLNEPQAAKLLQSMRASAEVAVIICDLDRSRLNTLLIGAAARLVTRSPVVHHDATASARAAFTREEFALLAERALAHPVQAKRLFPCRFLVTVDQVAVPLSLPAFASCALA